MHTITKVAAMQRLARNWRAKKLRIGFVPTMGYLHEGHLSLVRRVRQAVGKRGMVVVSIYVNPTQFGPGEDLSRYPRDLARDLQLCRKAGVDVIFAPDDAQMYPPVEQSSRRFQRASRPRTPGETTRGHYENGQYSTYIVEERLSKVMEGASRPNHFRGVTTIVVKLFNIVQPDLAVFGAKDFQQAAIVQRMVRDLNLPVRIVVAPTVRELDGLALSSRNKYLEGPLRAQAVALWQAIQKAQAILRHSDRPIKADVLKDQLRKLIEHQPAARVDYIEFFEPTTLQPLSTVARGAHMALAVFIGKTRLIDNARL